MDNKELLEYIRLFREKTNTNKLIAFVGAGVSCNVAGMPSWSSLIQKMAESIEYTRCNSCTKKEKNCQSICKFVDSFSTDEFLKIPQYVYNRSKKLYNQVLCDNIKHDLTIDAPLSNAILDLAPAHIITTNYDKLIENCKSIQKDNYEVIIKDKDLLNARKNKYIIKMHGDINNPDTIVLKEADYLEYTQNHILIEMFIKSLLTDHTILFLGYSLNDYNVKLIISWINYIRTQNEALDKETKFAYIVLDEKKIAKTQLKYFEGNNIGVINLNQMPLIENIPSDLDNDVGKRLYSFLQVIENPSLDNVFGMHILADEAITFMKRYKYIDAKSLCYLLYLKKYNVDGYELFIHLDSEYDRLIALLDTGNATAQYLQQLFFDGGIYNVRLISSNTERRDDYKITASHISLLEDKLYTAYLLNDYVKLSIETTINAQTSSLESCFYSSIVTDYTASIFEWHNSINYDTLTTNYRVRYLFNDSVLESKKTYHIKHQRITKYINGFTDTKEKRMYSLYLDLFEGNHRRLQELVTSFDKLKELYNNSNNSIIGGSSLSELYKIRRVALEQYQFYFNNTLLFKGFSDLKKILKYYIEAIICTNGRFNDTTNGAFGLISVKERYVIDILDFDIITKFISIKDLFNLIKDYSVDTFNVSKDLVNHAIICFNNIADSMMNLKIYNCFLDAPTILINCMILFAHFTMNTKQKNSIKDTLLKLFKDDDFINFFFSTSCSDFSHSTRALCSLLKIIPQSFNLDIVDKILHGKDFQSFYVNSDVRELQSIISYFISDDKPESNEEKLYQIIMSFEGRERISALRVLYKHTGASKHVEKYKLFLKNNFRLLNSDDIFDFTFDDWLDITKENSKVILSKAVSIYKQQQSSHIRSFPDPLQDQLELIYILFLTDKISSIECLHDIIDASDFLHFFLEPDKFEYRKIDFSNYMWENVARHERFMKKIIEHKSDVLPNLQRRVETDQATEFERKILYGFLLDKSEVLK